MENGGFEHDRSIHVVIIQCEKVMSHFVFTVIYNCHSFGVSRVFCTCTIIVVICSVVSQGVEP
jgi:hypothetical protein